MLNYGPNRRRRLGRPSKVLLDKAETGLLIHLHSIPFSGLCLAPKILDDGQSPSPPQNKKCMLPPDLYGAEDY